MNWHGMAAHDGTRIEDLAHLRQSIRDILTTPVGTRIMRRDYGSHIAELIDQPLNPATRQRILGATILALHRWEPRVRIQRIALQHATEPGQLSVRLDGVRVDGPRPRHLSPLLIPLHGGRA